MNQATVLTRHHDQDLVGERMLALQEHGVVFVVPPNGSAQCVVEKVPDRLLKNKRPSGWFDWSVLRDPKTGKILCGIHDRRGIALKGMGEEVTESKQVLHLGIQVRPIGRPSKRKHSGS